MLDYMMNQPSNTFSLGFDITMNKQLFDDIASKISANLPPLPTGVSQEFEQTIRSILHNAFDKLDLVTREDFDIQTAVLQKTRLKLEQLEEKLKSIEEKIDSQ